MNLSSKAFMRIEQWSREVCGNKPILVPVHHLAPVNRAYFNVRDFCKQHNATPVYGWAIDQCGPILKAQFYSLVRYHTHLFSITTTRLSSSEILFFEDRRHVPRLVETTYGCDLLHTFHALVYPEIVPAKKIEIVNPDDAVELQIEIPLIEKQKNVSLSKSYPAVESPPVPVIPIPAPEVQKEDAVIHPFLRKLKKYRLGVA